jgi:NAD(P)-dependent dehydrogenase (short-subunit alcohol dehydrogenase family)
MWPLDHLPLPRSPHVDDAALERAVAGKTVVVTGASSGIGRATALRLGRAGAEVLLVARREEELNALAGELPQATALPCDLSTVKGSQALADDLVDREVDVLISNAGHSILRTMARSDDPAADAKRLMALNYLAPVRLIGALLPGLASREGQVICVSSIAAQATAPGFAAYAASKAALDAYVRCIAREKAAHGVAFTSVHMPLVDTAMVDPSPDLKAELPLLDAEEAAELLATAVIHRPRRIATPAGELAAIGWALDPAITEAVDARLRPGGGGGPGAGGDSRAAAPWRRLVKLAVTTHVRR